MTSNISSRDKGDQSGNLLNTLTEWCGISTDLRDKRRYLEIHLELLDPQCEPTLETMISRAIEQREFTQAEAIREHLVVVRDARRRGGTGRAVCEAYVNVYFRHPLFALDVPHWLGLVEDQLQGLLHRPQREQTAPARIEILRRSLEQARKDSALAPETLAVLYDLLALSLDDVETPQSLEEAIEAYTLSLKVFTPERYPLRYADIMAALGRIYGDRVSGNRKKNLEKAVSCCYAALNIPMLAELPQVFSNVMTRLGRYYEESTTGSKRQNIEQAIRCYFIALQHCVQVESSGNYASIRGSLGSPYINIIEEKSGENTEKEISSVKAVLQVYTVITLPDKYATIMHNLGDAYFKRIAGDRSKNKEEAIYCYKAALQMNTLDESPDRYARSMHNLGIAYVFRLAGSRLENIEEGIDCYQAALHVWERIGSTVETAIAQRSLGTAYYQRLAGNPQENIEEAIRCFTAASNLLKNEDFPTDYATLMIELGNAYSSRKEGNPGVNIEEAIRCYTTALSIFTVKNNPEGFSNIMSNLGGTYCKRLAGVKQENIEEAIRCFIKALQIRTIEDAPYYYAQTQHNLSQAYQVRLIGNHYNNCLTAIRCCNEALRVYTIGEYPLEYRNTQVTLAEIALQDLGNEAILTGDRNKAHEAYRFAHAAFAAAQQAQAELGWLESDEQGRAILQGIYTKVKMMYVHDAWCLLKLGDIRQAVVALEAGRAQALAEAQSIADTSFDGVCEHHTQEYVIVRQDLRKARSEVNRAARLEARDRFLRIRNDIRAHCKQDFLPGLPSYDEIAHASASKQALLYVASVKMEGFALVVSPTGKRDGASEEAPFVISFPLLKLENIDYWLIRRDQQGNITGGYLIALQFRGGEVLQQWVERGETERECVQRRTIPFRDVADILSPDMTILREAIRNMVTDWHAKAESLSGGDPRQQKNAHTILAHLSMPLEQALNNRWVLSKLGRFFQQAELEDLLLEISVSVTRTLRKALDDHGLGDPDQQIALISCGVLGMLPIHAASARRHEATGEWIPFQETCELTIQASARSLGSARQALARLPVPPGPVLAVGNPELPQGTASQLPYAEAEALAIVRIARRQNRIAEAITGMQATRSRAMYELASLSVQRTGAIVHFATHGHADPRNPHLCYMLLANGERLTLADLQRQRLLDGTRLFNASGCVTAVGDFEFAPDEMGSLAAGALQAGTPCAIATLWPVSDRATFLLMVDFMERLAQGNSPAKSMRDAASWLRTATWAHLKVFAQKCLVELGLPALDVEHTRDMLRGMLSAEGEAFTELVLAKSVGDDIPYRHAIFWAATVLYGA